ncbi:glucose-1-phosphate thymidylyltransferase RfbA [Pseudoalteromonas xiamenensis]
MKGLILAGGTGSRLYPVTIGINKHLLPVLDKPMIYYPLSVLMLSNIKDIAIVCKESDYVHFTSLLGNGESLGIKITYLFQNEARGIADGIKIASSFLNNQSFCMILGDNFFFGPGLTPRLLAAKSNLKFATAFAYQVENPSSYGVISYNDRMQVESIEEKPLNPKSNIIATGLYMLDQQAVNFVNELEASSRGELEITDLLNLYIKKASLNVEILGRGFAWMDMGTNESLMEASLFIQSIEKRQGFKIACLEEIALRKGWIETEQLKRTCQHLRHTPYGEYLYRILAEQQ